MYGYKYCSASSWNVRHCERSPAWCYKSETVNTCISRLRMVSSSWMACMVLYTFYLLTGRKYSFEFDKS